MSKGNYMIIDVASSLIAVSLLVSSFQAPIGALELSTNTHKSDATKHANDNNKEANVKNSLEAELENIVQQHDGSFDTNDRSLADTIISRLMVDNLSDELTIGPTESDINELLIDSAPASADSTGAQLYPTAGRSSYWSGPTGPEALRLKKLLSMVQAYETMLNAGGGGAGTGGPTTGVGSLLPMLPAGQAATSKRASKLAGNYLQQRQANAANPSGYARSSFDFGLGKRLDTTGASSNILRFGDSLSGGGGLVAGANQFGKRPSAHRYDFGLGKRVASSAYPRYDFGLGKRAPIRYGFGLGKK